jgi:hypothetical protein
MQRGSSCECSARSACWFWQHWPPSAPPERISFGNFDLAGVPTTNFVIPAIAGTVDVQIYLKETNGGTILATQKLFGAGGQVTLNSPTGVRSGSA